jgi:hypothetical protein
MNAINRPCSVANLDPANDNVPYQDEAAFDVRDLVDVDEVMEREQLGPNGGVLWAMEEVETNFDWLEQQLEQCGKISILCPVLSRCCLTRKQRKQSFSTLLVSRSLQHITCHCRAFYKDLRNSVTEWVMKNLCEAFAQTDSVVDHYHTMSGLSRRHTTIVVLEQSSTLRQRNATPALPHRYDILFHSARDPQTNLTNPQSTS